MTDLGEGGITERRVSANGYEVSFGCEINVLKLDNLQFYKLYLCRYIKKHWTVKLQMGVFYYVWFISQKSCVCLFLKKVSDT